MSLPDRVTIEHIESLIASEYYFTASEGVLGASAMGTKPAGRGEPLDRFTICVLVLRNGCIIQGANACVRRDIWSAEKGKEMARADAVRQIWEKEGYLLHQRIYEERVARETLA